MQRRDRMPAVGFCGPFRWVDVGNRVRPTDWSIACGAVENPSRPAPIRQRRVPMSRSGEPAAISDALPLAKKLYRGLSRGP